MPREERSPVPGADATSSTDDRSSRAGSPAASGTPDRSTATSSGADTTAGAIPPSETERSEIDQAASGSVPPAGPTGLGSKSGSPESLRRGSVQRQEAGVTQPRPPTVAEARARDKARKRAEETQRAATAAAEAKKRTRKRVMIGGIAVVGVAGLVGGGYLAYRALTAPDQVTASCVKIENGQEVVVADDYCGDGRAGFISDSGSGGGSGPGVIFLGGGPQYRYYYGGTGTVGKPPTGGTTVKPRSAEIKTKSGTTVQRGGLGSKSTSGGS
ncbi:hypothetical protein AB0B25_08695 [Nocardia sp. NPDC049190]|uniref:hypothetical protein n=1 Tax=Nocardia sp. NPDC049190 TaxID=3155650 RepID=UPI003400ECCB